MGTDSSPAKLNFAHKEPSITMHTLQGINFLLQREPLWEAPKVILPMEMVCS